MKLLWENMSPASPMDDQTITLNESLKDYKFYMVTYKPEFNSVSVMSTGYLTTQNASVLLGFSCPTSGDKNAGLLMYRHITPLNATSDKFVIHKGYYCGIYNGLPTEYTGASIVLRIFGIKE